MRIFTFFFLLILTLTGCQNEMQETTPDALVPLPDQTPPVTAQSHMDIINFFVYLNHGKYEEAVKLYGGEYETLIYFNPDLDPEDKVGLLKRGCEQNGLQCLQLYSADLIARPSETEFVYTVTYRSSDGSQFVLGPCCGADETQMPPTKEFAVRVICGEQYPCQILDLPPYVP